MNILPKTIELDLGFVLSIEEFDLQKKRFIVKAAKDDIKLNSDLQHIKGYSIESGLCYGRDDKNIVTPMPYKAKYPEQYQRWLLEFKPEL